MMRAALIALGLAAVACAAWLGLGALFITAVCDEVGADPT